MSTPGGGKNPFPLSVDGAPYEGDGLPGEGPRRRGLAPGSVLIGLAIITVLGIVSYFVARELPDSKGGRKGGPPTANADDAFAVSPDYLRNAREALHGIEMGDSWIGLVANCNATRCAKLGELTQQMADTSEQVSRIVRNQGEQVGEGRSNLGNILSELQLAIPVADTLYFSSPAGPLLSYHYQLAVSNPAVSTSADIANTMADHAKNTAEQLNQWARRYDSILESLNQGLVVNAGSCGLLCGDH